MTISYNDVINYLTNLTPDSNLAKIRHERSVATENTQAVFEAIFSTPSTLLTNDVKYYFAHEVAKITGSPRLAEFYLQLIDSIPDEPLTQPLSTAKEYLQILTQSPKTPITN
ncbi:hypothetical protein AB6G22_12075 [Providencia hangzhouensis]|uniref:hypothetical protein n=1 Tax=Providencia hangzhouensis TaxID=3031799 RepID=UPI0034DD766A